MNSWVKEHVLGGYLVKSLGEILSHYYNKHPHQYESDSYGEKKCGVLDAKATMHRKGEDDMMTRELNVPVV